MTTRTIFDIETAPLPEPELRPFMPEFSAPSNYKDPFKVELYIAESRKEWISKAALSPLTGRVIAIGYWIQKGRDHSVMLRIEPEIPDEHLLLTEFWELLRTQGGQVQIVGFNIKRFDLPFLVRRSWKLGVPVPSGLIRRRYWSDEFVDLYEEWQLGDYQASISLDNLSKFLGIGQKNGSGADFAGLPRDKQEEYLLNDITLTAKAAELMLPKL